MLTPIITYKHAGLLIEIRRDQDAHDPRHDNSNVGIIVGWRQPHLVLGDRQVSVECATPTEIVAQLEQDGAGLVLPVHYTSHGARCQLDLGEDADADSLARSSGVVYVTEQTIKSAFGVRWVSDSARERATKALRTEIAEYSAYLTGDVFEFTVRDPDRNRLDSGSGFYDIEDCETDANAAAEECAERQAAEAREAYAMACRDIPTVRSSEGAAHAIA
jgi:hypothetical protein